MRPRPYKPRRPRILIQAMDHSNCCLSPKAKKPVIFLVGSAKTAPSRLWRLSKKATRALPHAPNGADTLQNSQDNVICVYYKDRKDIESPESYFQLYVDTEGATEDERNRYIRAVIKVLEFWCDDESDSARILVISREIK